jgi:hypothetical protein
VQAALGGDKDAIAELVKPHDPDPDPDPVRSIIMSSHPDLIAGLARQHTRELRELAEQRHRQPSPAARRRHGQALRQRTGWALVTLGLRLTYASER